MRFSRTGAGIVIVAIGASLTACSAPSGSDPKTLTILSNFQEGSVQGDILNDQVAAFEKSSGLSVKVSVVGESLPDVYETSVAGGKEADIVMINLAEKTNNWVKQGIAIPASKYLESWGLEDKINPSALKEWTNADGQVQGFPYQGFVWPVWYNMDLLASAGVTDIPTTTDELLTVAKKLHDAGVPGMAIGGNDWSGQKMFLQTAQAFMSPKETAEVYSKGGYCASANAMKGIELFTKLRDGELFVKDVQGYTADQMNAAFFDGKASIMSAGSWAFSDAPEKLNVQLGGLPVPAGGEYDKPTAMQGYTGTGFWVSPNGEKKIDSVKDFITSFYKPEVAARFTSEAATPTAVVSDSALTISNPLLEDAVNVLPDKVDFAVMPDTVVPGQLADAMIRQTSVAFAPGTTADAICAGLDGLY
jgi:ABC-type glycerol-3-phosphate transport system substrate-binding protein